MRDSKAGRRGRTMDPRELVEVPLRRPLHVLIPLGLGLLVAALAIWLLPKRYQSSTLILVESEKVPESVVQRMATETVRERVSTVNQEILSRTRLEKVIRDTNPYPDQMGRRPLTAIIDGMRRAVSVNVRGNDAFSIDFVHEDPKTAVAVANRLATLFIEETTREREQQIEGAYTFIESQLEDAREELARQEEGLRLYKERHLGSLPEQMPANLSTLQRLQLEEQTIGESLRAAEERRRLLADQLRSNASAPEAELAQLRTQLETLRLRYTDQHPDVRLVLARISRLERSLAQGAPAADGVTPQAQLAQVEMEIETLRARQQGVQGRIEAFQGRVEQAPRTEQDMATLTRDYQQLRDNYRALLNKKLDAQMASKLEERWRGEHFKVLDPAHLPDKPVFPKPTLFLVAGVLLGLLAGLGTAFAAESLDHSIKSLEDLEEIGCQPVLAAIPFTEFRVQRGSR